MGVIVRLSRRAATQYSRNVLAALGRRPDHEAALEHRPNETLEVKPSGRVGSPALPGTARRTPRKQR